jgi:hypothetical protein
MRWVVLSLVLLANAVACYSQMSGDELKKLRKKRMTNYAVTGTMVFFAGASDGVNQALMYQYGGFKKIFRNANDHFWKPSVSGANKYKNGDPGQGAAFPGSRTWLVFTTDGYHLTRFANHLFMSGAVAFKIGGYEKKKWYIYALEAVGYWIVNRAGFCFTYNQFVGSP